MPERSITADDIKTYLDNKHNRERFGTHESIGIAELSIGQGRDERRMDYWAIECWQSKNSYQKTCYEIKVSRSDWLSEKKKPQKRRQGLFASNLFYYISPKGIVKTDELPVECGLIEVSWANNQQWLDKWDRQMSLPDNEREWDYREHYLQRSPTRAERPEFKEFLTENVVRPALWRDEAFPTWRLVVNLLRRMKKEEVQSATV